MISISTRQTRRGSFRPYGLPTVLTPEIVAETVKDLSDCDTVTVWANDVADTAFATAFCDALEQVGKYEYRSSRSGSRGSTGYSVSHTPPLGISAANAQVLLDALKAPKA